ncbi:hypothetical protein GCM10027422_23000 [Hymenobacter arcticus]
MQNVFIVSPYNIDSLYTEKKRIIEILCEKYSVNFVRAEDGVTGRSLNAEETALLLQQCDCAIADLSYERPSCYYEVGYLQAIRKPVYLTSDTNTALHQALEIENVLLYSGLNEYRKIIEIFMIEIVDKCQSIASRGNLLAAD